MASCRGAAGWSFPATVALAFVPCILQTHPPPAGPLGARVCKRQTVLGRTLRPLRTAGVLSATSGPFDIPKPGSHSL